MGFDCGVPGTKIKRKLKKSSEIFHFLIFVMSPKPV